MKKTNLTLKAAIIQRFGKQAEAAEAFGIREDRLSRVIHRRVKPKPEEKRAIAWRLQRKIPELFSET